MLRFNVQQPHRCILAAQMRPSFARSPATLRRPCARHIHKYFKAGWPEGAALMRYAVVIEKTDGNYSAYVPDLPGCVATGDTVAVETEIRDAIRFHIAGLKEDGLPVPMATSIADYVET
jgi:predicted RNase H-like HicB family nuclease